MVFCKLGKPYFLLVFTYYYYLCLWLCTSSIHVKAAKDTLKPGGSLNDSDELCSENGKYCMGFFQLQGDSTYLNIHSVNDDIWKVWIADRNQPVSHNKSGFLSFNRSGVLKLESKDMKPIVLYSPSPAEATINNNTMEAKLLDTGNFVVQQLNPNGSTKSVLWQSYDFPTDTLFPRMKLGVNHKTGHNWSLVTWFSDESPAPGPFKLEWEHKEGELIITRREQVIWKSGKLRHNRFVNIPEKYQHIYKYNVVSNHNEDYFTFTTTTEDPITWKLYSTGQLRATDGKDIARADKCYGNNNEGGCQKWQIPSCRQHRGDVFEGGKGYPPTHGKDISNETNTSYAISDCQASCWNNCSCVGFMSLYQNNDSGCIFFFGKSLENIFFLNGAGQYFNKLWPQHRKGTKNWKWISGAIATALLIICPAILYLAIKKRKHMLQDRRTERIQTEMQDLADDDGSASIKDLEDNLNKEHDLKVFSYASVVEATSNFSSENKLGKGGFGLVYKMLNWQKRFNIIEGISQGLLYLHKYSRLRIIHRDLKASNILLDENMNPKISDFGIARMFTQQESMVNTNRIVGTYGYMSPEYAMEGVFSTKSDVYSFGVLLLEIISGRRNTNFYDADNTINLVGHAWELWSGGVCHQLMDPSLNDTFVPDEVQRCIHVGLLCVEHYANHRPDMPDIISMLTNKSDAIAIPKRPAFYVGRHVFEGQTSNSEMLLPDFTNEISTSTEIEPS
ncbi:hypothetical protein RIF29_30696 [Crotalaria pallida]|uniref:Receptor-like serine/threonine-protein kinase n=1 Tax=Crotalaria pallida TaxID=3830 RepID=A0AAN9HYE0_CROPI